MTVRGVMAENQGFRGDPLHAFAELERAKLVAEAANETKTRYLAAVSHEIRSPLNAIYGYAQLLERGDAVAQEEAGAAIRRSAEHIIGLIDGLLEISQVESGTLKLRPETIEIRALLHQIVEMFRPQAGAKGLEIELEVSERLPPLVRTDQRRFRQVLVNLVSNAIKYTLSGGVTIAVDYRSQVAGVTVVDTGIGIPVHEIEAIFEPFERGSAAAARNQPGIGLGLTVARTLARIMGGEITATSVPGKGSTFQVKLMMSAAPSSIPGGLPCDRTTTGRPAAPGEPRAALPAKARPYLDRLRNLARIGHFSAVDSELDELARDVPPGAGFAAMLRRHSRNFDARSLLKTLDDAALP